jgi:hypothetical protein
VNFPVICSNIPAASACREAFEDAKHCCQRGNQNPYIEEEQTTQWPKEKVQKDKRRSTKHTHKTKDRVTRTPLKTWQQCLASSNASLHADAAGMLLHITGKFTMGKLK